MQVLIVEDDDRIRAMLRLALEDEGYQVVESADTPSALAEVRSSLPDLVMVDLMLGEIDGYTCIREIRRLSDIPIVIVSARSDTHDIVAGLEAGADDYVTKPFQIKEITARLRALRRRLRSSSDPVEADIVLDAGPGRRLVLSTSRGAVSLDGIDLPLTVTEYRLLVELAQPPGRVLSRPALLASVWEHGYYGDERIVDVHIRRLRTKIERDPGKPQIVVTMRGMGYRLDPQ
ncbi:response regulator transcription factor [Kribbella sp. NPDC000426]|uniref:response regulator transcription factor n=1 Tax=Kribbella sp. NPDC000426 TaxID=3154255 RepID=UPI0033345FA0